MDSSFATFVGQELAEELGQALGRIEHCVGQLSDEQLGWRPRDDMNSVGNLVLHLTGNIRQLIIVALGGGADTRDRQAEFDERRPFQREALLLNLRAAITEASRLLTSQSVEDWLRIRSIRGTEMSGLLCAIRSVAHFRGHTQEIIHITRMVIGEHYHYAGPPPGKPRG